MTYIILIMEHPLYRSHGLWTAGHCNVGPRHRRNYGRRIAVAGLRTPDCKRARAEGCIGKIAERFCGITRIGNSRQKARPRFLPGICRQATAGFSAGAHEFFSWLSFVSNIGIDRSDLRFCLVKPSRKYAEVSKSHLRPLYTKL